LTTKPFCAILFNRKRKSKLTALGKRWGEIKMVEIMKEKFYTVEDLIKILPLTETSIRAYLKKGRIKGVKIGNKYYIPKENIQKFLNGEK